MEYIVNDRKYSVKYSELRKLYQNFCAMSNSDFMENIHDALHLAIMICWFKDVQHDYSLGDEGIVHELAHILTNTNTRTLDEIREDFELILKLV